MSGAHDSSTSPSCVLYNRFVELMLLVGIDDNTGLIPIDGDAEQSSEEILKNVLVQEYEPQVLAAVSSKKAIYFQPFLKEDPNYPYSQTTDTSTAPEGKSLLSGIKQCFRTSSFNKLSYKCDRERSQSFTVPDLLLPEEVIKSLPSVCFPDNANVFSVKPESSVHFLVLTGLSEKKTYATCLIFYRPYIIQKGGIQDEANHLFLTQVVDQTSREEYNQMQCFAPLCFTLVSKYPYFCAMKDCLSCLVSQIEQDTEEMFTLVKHLTLQLTMAPVPPAGNVAVSLELFQMQILLMPPKWTDKSVVDIPLHLVFLLLTVSDILKILACILTEERIVFISSNYALLTVIMETFLNFIRPFRWRFTYVPVLSTSSLELLEAPGSFMMGCHSKHLEVVEQIEGLVVVNINEGTVKINNEVSTTGADKVKTIPDIPNDPALLFRKICKRVRFQMEVSDMERPSFSNLEGERAYRRKKMEQFNTEISFACLELMVNLFRGVIWELKVDLRRFNRETFLQNIPAVDMPFYQKVLKSDMFQVFLEERMNEKVDLWSNFEAISRPYAKKVGALPETPVSRHDKRPLRKRMSVSIWPWPSVLLTHACETFTLPVANVSPSFIKSSIISLTKALEECRDLDLRASYLYLRGMFFAAEGNLIGALEDLLSLPATNAHILPKQFVQELFAAVSDKEQQHLLSRRGFHHLSDVIGKDTDDTVTEQKIVYKVTTPDRNLGINEFAEIVNLLEMADDYDTIQKLFSALVKPGSLLVGQRTFENFVLSYKENQLQCDEIQNQDHKLHEHECILRISRLIKTDFGTGRIVLTDKRLFFLKDVSNACKEILKLTDIGRLEKLKFRTILNKVDVLVIQNKERTFKFTAWLKDEGNCWFMLIEEMRAGKIVAEAIRDFTAIHQAVQNVLLVDALIRSAQEFTTHCDTITAVAESLCHFTKYVQDGKHNLPKDTSEALQHRVDPNLGNRNRKTVESLLYTPGFEIGGDVESGLPPRLWCGMGDGKVKAFDAMNWEMEAKYVQTKNPVVCLVSVGDTQVWAGSSGIYIIDTATITCNKTLTQHLDPVVDIVVTLDRRYAFSASVDGVINKWDTQTLTLIQQITLKDVRSLRSLNVHDDQIWCGTWQSIVVLDSDGTRVHSFQYVANPGEKPAELDCFQITETEVWAGCRREGRLIIWNKLSGQVKSNVSLECRGVSKMLLTGRKLWVGTKTGMIHIYNIDTHHLWKSLRAHDDAVRSLCCASVRYVMSGGGSKDGKVAIWKLYEIYSHPENFQQMDVDWLFVPSHFH